MRGRPDDVPPIVIPKPTGSSLETREAIGAAIATLKIEVEESGDGLSYIVYLWEDKPEDENA